jgi:hypothetical protein
VAVPLPRVVQANPQGRDINSWLSGLKAAGYAPSYVYALHARLAQILSDAVHDVVLARSPASRRTSPKAGVQRPYLATTEQVCALYEALGSDTEPGFCSPRSQV